MKFLKSFFDARQIGILQILLSGICFGFLGVFGKQAFALGLSAGEFLSLRFTAASLLLFTWIIATGHTWRIPLKKFISCIFLGICGYALFSSCYFYALNGLSASLTALLLYTYPVMVSVLAWIFFKEKLSFWQALALPLSFVGLIFLLSPEIQVRSLWSIVLGFASALFYSLYILFSSKTLKGVPSLISVFYIMSSAGIFLSILHVRAHTIELLPHVFGLVIAVAIIGTLAAMTLFLAGLHKLSSAEASILSASEPLSAIFLATFFLNESFQILQYLGTSLVLFSLLFASFPLRRLEKNKFQAKS